MAEACGVAVERPRVATLTQLEASEDQETFRCFFDTPAGAEGAPGSGDGALSVEADLMVAAEAPDTAQEMLVLLSDAGALREHPGRSYRCDPWLQAMQVGLLYVIRWWRGAWLASRLPASGGMAVKGGM